MLYMKSPKNKINLNFKKTNLYTKKKKASGH